MKKENNVYEINDQDVKRDFENIAKRMAVKPKWANIWYQRYLELTADDNNKKLRFIWMIDECKGRVWEVIQIFMTKTEDEIYNMLITY